MASSASNNQRKVTLTFPLRLEERRVIPVTTPGCTGTTSEHVGFIDHNVEITINFTQLLKMLGAKAVRSVGGVSKEASGAVVVKHIR